VSKHVVATFQAKGHLIDSGLLSDALEAVQAAGSTYRVVRLDIGKQRNDESQLELEVQAPNKKVFDRVRADLMSLGLSETETQDAVFAEVDIEGTAPEGFYSTTNLATEVRVAGQWLPVQNQRMDATVVDDNGTLRCVKLRDLKKSQKLVVGFAGIRITPFTSRKLQEGGGKFGFMQGGVSSERRLAAQVEDVVAEWKRVRAEGKKVILVAGPVVVHVGAGSDAGRDPQGRARRRPAERQRARGARHRGVAVRHQPRRRTRARPAGGARPHAPHARDQHDPPRRQHPGRRAEAHPEERRHARLRAGEGAVLPRRLDPRRRAAARHDDGPDRGPGRVREDPRERRPRGDPELDAARHRHRQHDPRRRA
jgi:hypothetical protein